MPLPDAAPSPPPAAPTVEGVPATAGDPTLAVDSAGAPAPPGVEGEPATAADPTLIAAAASGGGPAPPAVEGEPATAADPTLIAAAASGGGRAAPAVEAEPATAGDPTLAADPAGAPAPPAVEGEPGAAADPTLIAAAASGGGLAAAAVEAEPVRAGDPTVAVDSAGAPAPPAVEGEPGTAADPTLIAGAASAATPPPSEGAADATSGAPEGRSRGAGLAVAGTAAAKAALTELREQSAWVLGAAAILVAFAIGWLVGILLAFRHAPGYTARDRILQFFEPGSLSWALAILLALTLITIARKFDPAPARRSGIHELLPAGLFVAGAAVVVSSVIGILVELTNFGHGIDAAFAALIGYVAVLLVGAAATWWALLELKARRQASKPSD